jgi:hypothetical protein
MGDLGINWTTVLASAFTASIVGGSQFIFNRYLARALDRIEKTVAKINPDRNGAKDGNRSGPENNK